MDIQFFAAHAGLDDTVEILGIDGDDLVHLAHIERDAAVDGERIAFDRRPRPEWHDRDIGRRTQLYQRDDIVGRVSKDDGVGQHWSEMGLARRSEEHTSELQSLMRTSYAVFCLTKKTTSSPKQTTTNPTITTSHKLTPHT